jgi:hypothetical protein
MTAGPRDGRDPGEISERLAAEAAGLRFISEIDAPFVPVAWRGSVVPPLTVESLSAVLDARDAIELESIEEALRGHIEDVDPMDEASVSLVPRFTRLRDLLMQLLDGPVAVRLPQEDTELRLLLIGVAAGGIAGLETRVVES